MATTSSRWFGDGTPGTSEDDGQPAPTGDEDVEDGDGARVVPDDDAIARAIASVPGVAEAGIVRPAGGGRSRLTLRLHPGEDDQRVAWAVAATLRERFDIDLDPEAIRPRMTAPPEADHDPVEVVRTDDGERSGVSSTSGQVPWPPRDRPWTAREPLDPTGGAVHGAAATAGATGAPGTPADADDDRDRTSSQGQPIQLSTTRERLSRAVEDALAGLVGTPTGGSGAPTGTADADEPTSGSGAPTDTDGSGAPTGTADADGPTRGSGAPTDTDGSGAPTGTADADEPTRGSGAPTDIDAPTDHGDAPTDFRTTTVDDGATKGDADDAGAPILVPPPFPDAGSAAAGLRPPRAVIEHLEVRRGLDAVEVTVTLRHESYSASGTARAVPTSKGRMRATAEATVAAVHALVRTSLVVGVDRIVLTDGGDDVTVSVVLTMVTSGDEQRLLGGAIVRDDTDAEGAVVRATLDALNRRVVPLLVGH